MRSYCTLSDKNYIGQGLALINSIRRVSSEKFTLYYLCLDDETYRRLANIEGVVPVKLSDVEDSREQIKKYKQSAAYNEYCWSLASTFSRYLLEL